MNQLVRAGMAAQLVLLLGVLGLLARTNMLVSRVLKSEKTVPENNA